MKKNNGGNGSHHHGRRIGCIEPSAVRGGCEGTVLITGGAGFIGTNLADRLLGEGRRVVIFDNLSRAGVERNWRWLQDRHGERVELLRADVREPAALRQALDGVEAVFHFAAQVAVTTSLSDPVHDFEVNARGTLNLLEALRELSSPPPLLFTSTNKVYGALQHVMLRCNGLRYEPVDAELRRFGVSEREPLDFHSPYGCSKGFADQAVLDYARSFGLKAVVFRMSCIYGLHQCGNEDQGWVAHFVRSALHRRPITVYGDGCQVRDVLFADDLVEAMVLAMGAIDRLSGEAFNLGGGVDRTTSIVELLDIIEQLDGRRIVRSYRGWRSGDQRYYTSDIRRFSGLTGWRPRTGVAEGVERLRWWMAQELEQGRTFPAIGAAVSAGGASAATTAARHHRSDVKESRAS